MTLLVSVLIVVEGWGSSYWIGDRVEHQNVVRVEAVFGVWVRREDYSCFVCL